MLHFLSLLFSLSMFLSCNEKTNNAESASINDKQYPSAEETLSYLRRLEPGTPKSEIEEKYFDLFAIKNSSCGVVNEKKYIICVAHIPDKYSFSMWFCNKTPYEIYITTFSTSADTESETIFQDDTICLKEIIAEKKEMEQFVYSLKIGTSLDYFPANFKQRCLDDWNDNPDKPYCSLFNNGGEYAYQYRFSFCKKDNRLFNIYKTSFDNATKDEYLFGDYYETFGAVCDAPQTAISDTPLNIPAGFFVFGYDSVAGEYNTYLGCWSCTETDSDSIHNSFGSYGSSFSSTSIRNSISTWGSSFSSYSACNDIALYPPIIVDETLAKVGELSNKTFSPSSVCFNESSDDCVVLKSYCGL